MTPERKKIRRHGAMRSIHWRMTKRRKVLFSIVAVLLVLVMGAGLVGYRAWRSLSDYPYAVLIGETSLPPYDQVPILSNTRELRGPISVYGQGNFGNLTAQWSGEKEIARFDAGGIVILGHGPSIKLTGNLDRELSLFIVKRLSGSEWIVLKKAKLSGQFETEFAMEE
jgi:hypothetical protein